ncbi:DNA polymerase III subunit gamma/tau, partial [Rhodovastum sp. RN2-1]|nr:DNA polymerase III subunit gamma/tau [Limobrevibacterium gyesilva]
RAVAGGASARMAAAEPAPAQAPGPRLASLRDVAALVAEQREPTLHGHLVHSVHLVRFAPPVIELRPEPDAPRDLAARVAAILQEATGTRWTIALSTAQGEPTLAEQGVAADTARRNAAAEHPLVRAILDTFPGARIEAVHDSRTDAYGLLAEPTLGGEADVIAGGDDDMPEFAPVDAAFVDDPSDFWENQS